MKKVVVLMSLIFGTSTQQPPCECFSVNTIDTSLLELASCSPLYSQVASTSSRALNLNTVCYNFARTCTPNNLLVEQANTFNNGSVMLRASIQSRVGPGHFSVVGPDRKYDDYALGNPCPGTYVFYRCPKTGKCVTDPTLVDVFVASTRFADTQECISRGMDIALAAFPGIDFYYLPRNSYKPCTCQITNPFNSYSSTI